MIQAKVNEHWKHIVKESGCENEERRKMYTGMVKVRMQQFNRKGNSATISTKHVYVVFCLLSSTGAMVWFYLLQISISQLHLNPYYIYLFYSGLVNENSERSCF